MPDRSRLDSYRNVHRTYIGYGPEGRRRVRWRVAGCALRWLGTAEVVEGVRGVTINLGSDSTLISSEQPSYARDRVAPYKQLVKLVSYPVVKTGAIGLTLNLATYWADAGARANTICPGSAGTNQNQVFLHPIKQRIPLGRLAFVDEYQSTTFSIAHDASAYMTGVGLPIDGGQRVRL